MAQFVSETVAAVREEPTRDDTVVVVVQSTDGDQDALKEWLTAHGASIKRTGSFGLVKASLPETEVEGLCKQDFVRSVESPDDSIEFQNTGN